MFTIFACVFGVFECLNEFSYIRDCLLMHAVIVFDMHFALFGVFSGLKECASWCTGGEYGDEVSELFGELCVAGMVGVAFGVGVSVFTTVTCSGDCSCGESVEEVREVGKAMVVEVEVEVEVEVPGVLK